MSRVVAALAALVFLAGCGSVDPAPTEEVLPEVTSTPTSAPIEPTEVDAGSSGDEPTETIQPVETTDPVVVFIALLDEALAGTQWQADVFDSPEVFVATAELFCERLDESRSVDEILETYAEAVRDGAAAEDDASTLAGSILGTAVGTLCTEHRATVEALQ